LLGLKTAGKLPFASSLCGACSEVCPVKIDIPHQLVHLRYRAANEPSSMNSLFQRTIWTVWAFFMGGEMRYRLAARGLRLGMPLIKLIPRCLHPSMLGAWTRGREVPSAQRPAFRTWWRRHGDDFQPKS